MIVKPAPIVRLYSAFRYHRQEVNKLLSSACEVDEHKLLNHVKERDYCLIQIQRIQLAGETEGTPS